MAHDDVGVAHGAEPSELLGDRRHVAPHEGARLDPAVAVVDRGYRRLEPSALVWGDVAAGAEEHRRPRPRRYTDGIVRHPVADQPQHNAPAGRPREARTA